MSDPVAVDSRLPSSPFGSAGSGIAPLFAPDSIAIWQSSPSKPASTPPRYHDFDVEELSENNADYPHHAQVLHPYELEEVDTPVADRSRVNEFDEVDEEAFRQDLPHESESTALACRLRRIRWRPVSRPSASTRSSPVPFNTRKRLRLEAPDTDTDSEGFDSSYTRSEPPRVRRRTQGPEFALPTVTPPTMSDASTPQATTTTSTSDEFMDVDEQAL
jgi:hypothetical protein